tara:strand:- start:171 stop:335 length:165 start_codon:yes stop_codon:yes gene_type:complete
MENQIVHWIASRHGIDQMVNENPLNRRKFFVTVGYRLVHDAIPFVELRVEQYWE